MLHDVRLRLRALLRGVDGDDGVDRADGHDGADDGLLVKMYRTETTVAMGQLGVDGADDEHDGLCRAHGDDGVDALDDGEDGAY